LIEESARMELGIIGLMLTENLYTVHCGCEIELLG
jgi:hypothetical protein